MYLIFRLIPTVPLRLNYLLWLQDIFKSTSKLDGIDIGTGASCVYPLLAGKLMEWKFVATETDELNFNYACHNVDQNKLTEQIKGISCNGKV